MEPGILYALWGKAVMQVCTMFVGLWLLLVSAYKSALYDRTSDFANQDPMTLALSENFYFILQSEILIYRRQFLVLLGSSAANPPEEARLEGRGKLSQNFF